MNEKTLKVLEYPLIIQQLSAHATSDIAEQLIRELKPSVDVEIVKHSLNETDEMTQIYNKHRVPGYSGLKDIKSYVKRSQIGSLLYVEELNQIKKNIQVQNRFKTFYTSIIDEDEEILYPLIDQYVMRLPVLSDLLEQISSQCDEHDLFDNASPKLAELRYQIKKTNDRIKTRLEQMVRSQANQKKLSDSIITVRNDRHVIPVKAEYRQDFSGIVHDQSASGQTLYIEPNAIVEMHNQISQVKAKEKEEKDRLLYILTEQVSEVAYDLLTSTEIMGHLDFITAKAKFGATLKATKPVISDERAIYLPKARHPLIDKSVVVSNTIEFKENINAVIITGPNTGGKTVTLKTVGLITLMAQSGLLIPTLDGSIITVFNKVFCDIGDEQSIEQSLSTFSSHMKNIVNIIDSADSSSLILFDELGAGTDPSEGAALAMSILDYTIEKDALIMATTHYPELKAYSYNRDKVMNASVEFDVETLRPTYKLLMGIPGRSNAFEISKKLGLKNELINNAKSLIGQDEKEINVMIESLEKNAKTVENDRIEVERLKQESESLHKSLSQELQRFENFKTQLMDEARNKANQEVKQKTKEAEMILQDLRQMRDQSQANIKEHELIEKKKQLDSQYTEKSLKQKVQKERHDKIKIGDDVKVLSYGQKGEVIDLVNDEEAIIQMGILKMKIEIKDLEKLDKKKQQPKKIVTRTNRSSIKMDLDLRGYRFEEAMSELDQYLDQAVLSNYGTVNIIHGKGTGALQKGVADHLKRHRSVESYRTGTPSEGGFGVTVVTLK
ncbi:endonuclease MutS2 [Mammaliicoccus stepanovicii]|uniref:Endonuclease MutS2 n=1 Tax=Mammaliicoccus stepanovicii TaxID=643214 RepID=A0A239ZNA5_9STAP|nr:endonuclease MutS2 [Mammaliicoccus stepanovicii]PNZ79232.1 endonuclease MutS2 [Mammaliicoccus stepanovicii]GGI41539.1 endonuclease MutS2 [Mammaliicoccus stepanovicii]SNV72036.1 recombination and DNA strand exchange inhibitor protein [Mammaliicoccus stepanovicii]